MGSRPLLCRIWKKEICANPSRWSSTRYSGLDHWTGTESQRSGKKDNNSEINERFKTKNEAKDSLLSPLVLRVTASSQEQRRSSVSRTETCNQNSK